jgi:hypothetical protein
MSAGFALAAVPAAAEISSVDAYGGQAAVLGAPVHRHHVKTQGSQGRSGGGSGAGAHTGAAASGSFRGPTSSSTAGSSRGAAGGMGTVAPGHTGTGVAAQSRTAGSTIAPGSEADSSLSLSGLDVFVLVAMLACLVGTGVLMRRLGRRAE